MTNKDFLESLGIASAIVVGFFFLYPVIVGFLTLRGLVHGISIVNDWVVFSSLISVYIAWFMSWVTGRIWKATENN